MVRDKGSEVDIVEKVAALRENVDDLQEWRKVVDGRWDKGLAGTIKGLILIIVLMGGTAATGAAKSVRDKVIAVLSWMMP